MPEENKAIVRRLMDEVWRKGNLSSLPTCRLVGTNPAGQRIRLFVGRKPAHWPLGGPRSAWKLSMQTSLIADIAPTCAKTSAEGLVELFQKGIHTLRPMAQLMS
jgi:hypothetical protein